MQVGANAIRGLLLLCMMWNRALSAKAPLRTGSQPPPLPRLGKHDERIARRCGDGEKPPWLHSDCRQTDPAAWWLSTSAASLCRANLGVTTQQMQLCGQLKPAGTATGTLTKWLQQTFPAADLSPGMHTTGRPHSYGVIDWLQSPGRGGCFLSTLRDPVERLESGCRFEMSRVAGKWKDHQTSLVRLRNVNGSFTVSGLQGFVRALRNASDPAHVFATAVYRRGARVNRVESRTYDDQTLVDGRTLDNFLVSQVAYLRDVNCRKMGFQPMCTTADGSGLERGWKELLGRFGQPFNESVVATRAHSRSKGEVHAGRRLDSTVPSAADRISDVLVHASLLCCANHIARIQWTGS